MSRFDGVVLPVRLVVNPKHPDLGKGNITFWKEQGDAIIGDMVPVREEIVHYGSGTDRKSMIATRAKLYAIVFQYLMDWQGEMGTDRHDGTIVESNQKAHKDPRVSTLWIGSGTVRIDGSRVFGEQGIMVDFTIKNGRIVKVHVMHVASPMIAWNQAYTKLHSMYPSSTMRGELR